MAPNSPAERDHLLAGTHPYQHPAMASDGEISSNNLDNSPSSIKDKSTITVDGSTFDTKASITKQSEIRENVERYAQLFGADEEAFDQPTTTKKELWAYYLYYNGDNGVGPGSYSQTL